MISLVKEAILSIASTLCLSANCVTLAHTFAMFSHALVVNYDNNNIFVSSFRLYEWFKKKSVTYKNKIMVTWLNTFK